MNNLHHTVCPKKYAHGFCFAVLCCGYTLTDFPISIRLTSLTLWQSNDCPSASKATLINMDKYLWIHYERLHNHNKAKHNKTVCIFLGIYCSCASRFLSLETTEKNIHKFAETEMLSFGEIKTPSCAASDENFIKMILFPFQCSCKLNHTNIRCRPCSCVHNTLRPCVFI